MNPIILGLITTIFIITLIVLIVNRIKLNSIKRNKIITTSSEQTSKSDIQITPSISSEQISKSNIQTTPMQETFSLTTSGSLNDNIYNVYTTSDISISKFILKIGDDIWKNNPKSIVYNNTTNISYDNANGIINGLDENKIYKIDIILYFNKFNTYWANTTKFKSSLWECEIKKNTNNNYTSFSIPIKCQSFLLNTDNNNIQTIKMRLTGIIKNCNSFTLINSINTNDIKFISTLSYNTYIKLSLIEI